MPRLALFLLLAALAAPAHALGLGAARLQSWLGQPLKVTVPLVLENGTAPDIGCFSISSTEGSGLGPPSDTALHYDAAGTALVITSRTPVQNLALEFAIVADCRHSHVTRNYSLLLDPPPAISPASAEAAPAPKALATPAPRRRAEATPIPPAPRVHPRAMARTRPNALRRSHPPTRHPTRLSHATRPPPRALAARSNREGPRLNLSGSGGVWMGSGNLALQLDTTLTPPPAATTPPPTTASMEAQAAALRQTLDGLQKELNQLRKRNAELQARLNTPPPPPPAPKSSFSYGWLAAALSLLVAAATLAWALHRRPRAEAVVEPEEWAGTPAPPQPVLKVAMPIEGAEGSWCELPAMPPPTEGTAGEAQTHTGRPPPSKRPESHDAEAYPFHGRRTRESGTEVNESAVDRAEVFLAFGHADLAIHLLEEHLAENPTESPVPWLLLLELLEREGLKKEYQEARLSCKVHFNLQVADLDETVPTHSLEDFPHILNEVKQRWNSAEIVPYLDGLLRDDRGGMRRGFDPGTFRDILFLRQLAEAA